MILAAAGRWTLAGTIIGLAGCLATARVLKTLLFGVSPYNAVVLASSVTVLVSVALLATLLPARRAATVDPVNALRVE